MLRLATPDRDTLDGCRSTCLPPDVVAPRYGERSLAEVVPALLAALGVPASAQRRSAITVPPVRAAGLLLVDGLGADLLRRYAADAPFLAGLQDAGPLTVGFPSSTATSLTSLGTGTPPGGTASSGSRCGWARRGGRRCCTRCTGPTADQPARRPARTFPPEGIQPGPTALERAAGACVAVTVVSARRFKNSGLTRAALRGGQFRGVTALGDLAAEMVTALRGPGLRFVYGYHADLDALGTSTARGRCRGGCSSRRSTGWRRWWRRACPRTPCWP